MFFYSWSCLQCVCFIHCYSVFFILQLRMCLETSSDAINDDFTLFHGFVIRECRFFLVRLSADIPVSDELFDCSGRYPRCFARLDS